MVKVANQNVPSDLFPLYLKAMYTPTDKRMGFNFFAGGYYHGVVSVTMPRHQTSKQGLIPHSPSSAQLRARMAFKRACRLFQKQWYGYYIYKWIIGFFSRKYWFTESRKYPGFWNADRFLGYIGWFQYFMSRGIRGVRDRVKPDYGVDDIWCVIFQEYGRLTFIRTGKPIPYTWLDPVYWPFSALFDEKHFYYYAQKTDWTQDGGYHLNKTIMKCDYSYRCGRLFIHLPGDKFLSFTGMWNVTSMCADDLLFYLTIDSRPIIYIYSKSPLKLLEARDMSYVTGGAFLIKCDYDNIYLMERGGSKFHAIDRLNYAKKYSADKMGTMKTCRGFDIDGDFLYYAVENPKTLYKHHKGTGQLYASALVPDICDSCAVNGGVVALAGIYSKTVYFRKSDDLGVEAAPPVHYDETPRFIYSPKKFYYDLDVE